jgi:hypothetical protein
LFLGQSKCFTGSRGRLSCITCHAPHSSVSRAATEYDAKCSGCHAMVKHRAAVVGKSCSGCHMPGVEPGPYLRFANHWIGVYATGNPLRPLARR